MRPLIIDFHLRNPFIFGMLDACKPLFATESKQEKARIYANPEFRAAFRAQFRGGRDQQKFWESVELKEVANPKLEPLLWSSVAQIARTRGQDPMDVFFDLPLEDDLKSVYMVPLLDIDPERVGRKLSDPRTMIGLSDGGAHVDMLCNAGYPTYLLGTFVRERQALALEYAIKRITSEPAILRLARPRPHGAGNGRRHHDLRSRHGGMQAAPGGPRRSPPRRAQDGRRPRESGT